MGPNITPTKENTIGVGGGGVYNNRTHVAGNPVVTPPIKNIRLKETGLQKNIRGVFANRKSELRAAKLRWGWGYLNREK